MILKYRRFLFNREHRITRLYFDHGHRLSFPIVYQYCSIVRLSFSTGRESHPIVDLVKKKEKK